MKKLSEAENDQWHTTAPLGKKSISEETVTLLSILFSMPPFHLFTQCGGDMCLIGMQHKNLP